MFILFSISRGLKFGCVTHTLIYKNSDSNVFKNINFLGKISYNWAKDLLGTNVFKTLEFRW